jgi:hypothetical protein
LDSPEGEISSVIGALVCQYRITHQTAFEPSLEFLLDIQAHHYTIPNMFLLESYMVLGHVAP